MIESVNANNQAATSSLQNPAAEQENVQRRNQDEAQNAQQNASADSVTISNQVSEAEETPNQTSIQSPEQAQETASRVVGLFQEQPELAASAQGGRVTSEKVDAFLSQNFG